MDRFTSDHDAIREQLPDAALDLLSPEERARLEAHLAGCPACAEELAELRDAAAAVSLAAPLPPDTERRLARVRDGLFTRIGADSIERRRLPPPGGGSRGWWWLGIAAVLALAVSVGLLGSALRERRQHERDMAQRAAAAERAVADLRDSVAARDRLIAELTGPGVAVVKLTASGAAPPSALMFWDRPRDRWTFIAHHLAAPADQHVYELWLIDRAGRKIGAGTFTPGGNGSALVHATYRLAADSLSAIAVTVEPAGGVPQPTGPIVLAGSGGL